MPNSPSLSGSLKFIYRVVLLLAAATLSACGGGDDAENSEFEAAFCLLLTTRPCAISSPPPPPPPPPFRPPAPPQQFDCAAGDVGCLIQAINAANANTTSHDTINLAAGTYTLTAVNNTTDGPNGLPSITSLITLNGAADSASGLTAAAAPRTIIERDASAQPFRLLHNAYGGRRFKGMVIEGISFRGGSTVTGEPNIHGGAIFNRGELTLRNSTVSGNHASEGFGGGIFNAGHLNLIGSTVSENDALADGGISNSNDLNVAASTVSNNTSFTGGGGIGSSFILRLANSTVSGNHASEGFGGGIFNAGYLDLLNSTVSGNSGGGIFNSDNPNLSGDTMRLTHTIVAGNFDQDLSPDDCVNNGGALTPLGHNLVGAGAGCPSDGPGDQTVDPATVFTDVLGPLQDNGGPTYTHALLPGSPAIDAGEAVCTDANGAPLTTDQRGLPRPVDGNCDIGAFEAALGSPPFLDQEQPLIDSPMQAVIGGGHAGMVAQVVTTGVSGILTEVRFPVRCGIGSDLIVEIQGVAGSVPNGVVLTSETIPGTSLPSFFPDPPRFESLVFSAPVFFSAGSPFAIVLRTGASGNCGVLRGPRGDPYPGGDGFFDSRLNLPGFWEPFGDLPFQTLVIP